MVPGAGLEPALCCQNRILNPARLPISPPRRYLGGSAASGSGQRLYQPKAGAQVALWVSPSRS